MLEGSSFKKFNFDRQLKNGVAGKEGHGMVCCCFKMRENRASFYIDENNPFEI